MDGSQKEGSNFLNLLQKEGVSRSGGVKPWRKLCSTVHGFRDSVPVLKVHGLRDSVSILKVYGCYKDTQKFEQRFIPVQAIQGDYSVLM